MHHVLISLASNHEQEKNLCDARQALAQILSSAVYTDAIWTEPEGKARHSGMRYLNQLVSAQTFLSPDELNAQLKEIETRQGRNDEMRSLNIVPIDLDLLEHNGTRYHLRDWQRNYVQLLLRLVEKT